MALSPDSLRLPIVYLDYLIILVSWVTWGDIYWPIIDSIHKSMILLAQNHYCACVQSRNNSREFVTRSKTLYSSISSSMNLQTCEPRRKVYGFTARQQI